MRLQKTTPTNILNGVVPLFSDAEINFDDFIMWFKDITASVKKNSSHQQMLYCGGIYCAYDDM